MVDPCVSGCLSPISLKNRVLLKIILIFLEIFEPLDNPNICFSSSKRSSCGHVKKKIMDPNVPATTHYLDCMKQPYVWMHLHEWMHLTEISF